MYYTIIFNKLLCFLLTNVDNAKFAEPIFNNHFHCFSDNDYLIINSPPQNTIHSYIPNSPSLSSTISSLKKSMKYFSI